MTASVLVIAKAPLPGRCKTRLCPPCTPRQAALLAEAALADTLDTVAATRASRRVVVLDGKPGPWLPRGFEVVAQHGDGLAERLAHAFADASVPALLVGMDTPQLTSADVDAGLAALERADACLGLARDGGYWAIGLREADARVFAGVPMSNADTGHRQLTRLRSLGLRCAALPERRDVDTIADARAVAALAPRTRFAAQLAAVDRVLEPAA